MLFSTPSITFSMTGMMIAPMRRRRLAILLLWLAASASTRSSAFTPPVGVVPNAFTPRKRIWVSRRSDEVAADEVAWMEERDDDTNNNEGTGSDKKEKRPTEAAAVRRSASRWESLNPRIRARFIQASQDRAIANKKKREPAQDKKRRMMMFVKEKQKERERANHVKRPLPFKDRTPLSALLIGMEMSGVVISLTNFGAYVDVGTECDGLLHVSQMTHDFFVQHPKQVVAPGDVVTVRVRNTSPQQKKLHLTMLRQETLQAEQEDEEDDGEEKIRLDEIQVDDELWGEILRVTDYGAYVNVGAVVKGFLHFMDHPLFLSNNGAHPREFMGINDRVRVWVSDVDLERQRIKLTANRPTHLPGPRRELNF